MSKKDEYEEERGGKWFPLESNPDVMNKYVEKMGFDTDAFCFFDLLSTEDWAMEAINKPVLSLFLLFPIKDATDLHRSEESERIGREGQIVSPRVFFTKQTVGNACGTIGLLHAIGNISDRYEVIRKDSFLDRFFARTRGKGPDEIAEILENDIELEETHKSAAMEGQSDIPSPEEIINSHFICFTHVDGHLYELDGRKEFPINHGPSSEKTFFRDATKVVQGFMNRDPTELRFTTTVLAATRSASGNVPKLQICPRKAVS